MFLPDQFGPHPNRRPLRSWNRRPLLLTLLLSAGCSSDSIPVTYGFGDPWTTEAEFELGARTDGNADISFSLISDIRILSGGARILVAEAAVGRATIWTPSGSLIREVGGVGEGPGQFSGQFLAQVLPDGFLARDARRFTSFNFDGAFVETFGFPPPSLSFRGFRLRQRALLSDGSFLAIPVVPAPVMMGAMGDDPIESLPVLRLSEGNGSDPWSMDTVATLNARNRYFIYGESVWQAGVPMEQFYGDYDLTWFDPFAGSVVVVGRAGGNGEVALTEVSAQGDTLWRLRLRLPPVSPPSDLATTTADAMVRSIASRRTQLADPALRRRLRREIEDGFYIPDPLPGANKVRGTASGEIWLRGFEDADTATAVWYAVQRNGHPQRIRRVLIPHNFDLRDASDTHVWGVQSDELGVHYVARRRLVAPSGQANEDGSASAIPDISLTPGPSGPPDESSRPERSASPGSWTVRVEHRIEEPDRPGEGFDRFVEVRVGGNGDRIIATDGRRSGRVRVWTPEGALLRSFGSAALPGGSAIWISPGATDFRTRETGTGWVIRHAYEGEGAVDSLKLPPGFRSLGPTPEGGFLSLADIPSWSGWDEHGVYEPPGAQAVLYVSEADGGWALDTIFSLDIRRSAWYVAIHGEQRQYPSQVSISQPFPDTDRIWFDMETGSVGVARRNGPPGVVELFEVLARGDTVWYRRLSLPAVPMPPEEAEQAIQDNLANLDRGHGLSATELREIAENAVHVPSHLPAFSHVVATASGEVWLRTPEIEDGLSVWYSVERGENESESRRVLIPPSFALMDAFGEYVWGLSPEASGLRVILGLRLVPPSPESASANRSRKGPLQGST